VSGRPAGRVPLSGRLPGYPWDRLAPFRARAEAHPGGVVDLSVGTPVDATPDVVRAALATSANAPGYPLTAGTETLRVTVAEWFNRRLGVPDIDPGAVLPTIGSKELVAWLPTLLGLTADDVVAYPRLAYPTYEIGALVAGCQPVATDSLTSLGPQQVGLLWLNSPANPHGKILPLEHLAKIVAWARERGVVVASDECYIEYGWEATPISVLHPDVCGGTHERLLAVHSLSKRSNMAGYRGAFIAGDPALIASLREARKHAGMMVPSPVQAAMTAALADDSHIDEQRARYETRRALLRAALEAAGFRIDHSEGSIYLWATRGEPCWDTIAWFADLGIFVGPGDFYGPTGARHVRVAFTETDERVAEGVSRLTARAERRE
jgi:succinyldiaminopimelate transaminase